MARSKASAQLIHASLGPAAPLIHASVGPNAQLTSAHVGGGAQLISAPTPRGGYGSSAASANGAGGGGANAPVAVLAEQGVRGSGYMNRGQRGRTETVASIGTQKFNAAQVSSAIDRGKRGQRLSRNDQAIYDAYLKQQSDAEAAAKAQEAAQAEETKRQNALNDKLTLQKQEADLRDRNSENQEIRKAQREKEQKEANDAAEEAWNERWGVDKGTRLSANEKKMIEDGSHAWGVSKDVQDRIDKATKDAEDGRMNGTLSDSDYEDAMAQIEQIRQGARKGLQKKPVDPNKPNVQTIDGKRYVQNGTKWELLDTTQPQSAQQIVEGAYTAPDGSRYITDANGKVSLLPANKPDTTEDQRRKYMLSRLESARKAFESRDPLADGYDANATFDGNAVLKSAGEDWDSVYGPSDSSVQSGRFPLSDLEKQVLGIIPAQAPRTGVYTEGDYNADGTLKRSAYDREMQAGTLETPPPATPQAPQATPNTYNGKSYI